MLSAINFIPANTIFGNELVVIIFNASKLLILFFAIIFIREFISFILIY